MDGASGISKQRWATVQQQAKSSILWRAHNLPFPDANKALGVKDLGDHFRQPVKSSIPTLFLSSPQVIEMMMAFYRQQLITDSTISLPMIKFI